MQIACGLEGRQGEQVLMAVCVQQLSSQAIKMLLWHSTLHTEWTRVIVRIYTASSQARRMSHAGYWTVKIQS